MASMNFRSRWNSRDFPLPLETRARTPALPGVGAVAVEEEEAAEEVVVEVVVAVVG
jgi:hypothetical protein